MTHRFESVRLVELRVKWPCECMNFRKDRLHLFPIRVISVLVEMYGHCDARIT